MKANEFVKKYGIAEAKALVNAQSWTMRQIALSTTVDTKELTRLVESHGLVSSFGGIKRAKRILKKSYMSFSTMVSVVWNDKPFQCTLEQLEQAILDVESCHVD